MNTPKENPSIIGHGLPKNTYNNHSWIIGDPKIGENVWIGAFTLIDGSGGLEIGPGCNISSGVHIYTHSSHKRCVSAGKFKEVERKPTKIGECTFIGANAIILFGVTIGKHCIIGAGAVVSKNISDYSVAVGVPARIVGKVKIEENGEVIIQKEKEDD